MRPTGSQARSPADARPLPGPREIPAAQCRPRCHDCCRSPAVTPQEHARLAPRVTMVQGRFVSLASRCGFVMVSRDSERCPLLGPGGCTVYADRPLVCRLFGATAGVMELACPHGCGPADAGDTLTADEALRLWRAAGANV
ncbi:MAG: YkgJ family cysteine cluster protein [Rhizorhabdus sp.]|nr:YkgJ family cysteine cluster protein [Rhizorhabdus sp.]MBP8233303.1 YkgJ family cysteine cluster protein [Rhizorhabdus sp.]